MLDCGHVPTDSEGLIIPRPDGRFPASGATGYATTPDGRRICYPCASEREAENMRATGRGFLYQAENNLALTDWPGTLRFVVFRHSVSTCYVFGRKAERVDYRFVGPDGYVWHAVHIGDGNTYARAKRTTKRATKAA